MSEWINCKLSDACSAIDYGLTASATDEKTGVRFLRITDIVSANIDWKTVPYVVADEDTIEKYKLHEADIVLARTGASTGTSSYVKIPPKAVFASYLVRLKIKPEFNARFISYYLKSEFFWSFIRGVLGDKSAQPNASAATMTQAPLHAPRNKEEQRSIAHILGTLDDKIELNRRMNETLEAMARAIFKSWFVDFDPVRAKAEGRDTGLPKEIADLFPDSFEETELGEVPKGWKISKLSNVCEYIMSGGTPSTQIPAYWDGDIPWLSSGETRNCFITKTEKTITNLGVEKSSTRLARAKSTVIAGAGQGHTRGQTSLLLFDSYINQSVVALAADSKQVSDYYLFFNLSGRYEELRQISDSHSSRGSLTTKLLNNLDIIIPSLELVSKFSQFTEAVVGQIQQNLLQSSMLTELRDTLLPKLISGELRVSDTLKIMDCVYDG